MERERERERKKERAYLHFLRLVVSHVSYDVGFRC